MICTWYTYTDQCSINKVRLIYKIRVQHLYTMYTTLYIYLYTYIYAHGGTIIRTYIPCMSLGAMAEGARLVFTRTGRRRDSRARSSTCIHVQE